jgi:sirohydrochlorin ferrochelatase/(2Fe-2S) ferredoxin
VKRRTILVVGHGSRDTEANVEFEAVVAAFRQRQTEFEVAHGYIELAKPSLAEALDELGAKGGQVVVLPLLLLAAGHVKNDIPLALATARHNHPETDFISARALGVHPALVSLLRDRADQALAADPPGDRKTAILIVGRGASDPDANADFCKLVRLFAEGTPYTSLVQPCFIGIAKPRVEEALETMARVRPGRLLVVPYFLFAGRLLTKLQEQLTAYRALYPWIQTTLAPHLGNDPRLLDVMDERAAEALEGRGELPCDTCQFRVQLPGFESQVGGLKALLWSMRHSYTHTQAVPHIHAHRPIHKHVLVCVNRDCADRGSVTLMANLRRLVKEAGRELDIKVTQTLCMGRCGEGPTMAVYPDGIWYRAVQPEDASELVREHLIHDRLVARLVDNIMS